MFLSSAHAQISDKNQTHKPDLSECILLMSCTVVVLSDNNLTCASDTFTNVFRENVAARISLASIWYFISARLNAPPVRILLQTAPHQKLLLSKEISITGLLFLILFLELFMLLYHC